MAGFIRKHTWWCPAPLPLRKLHLWSKNIDFYILLLQVEAQMPWNSHTPVAFLRISIDLYALPLGCATFTTTPWRPMIRAATTIDPATGHAGTASTSSWGRHGPRSHHDHWMNAMQLTVAPKCGWWPPNLRFQAAIPQLRAWLLQLALRLTLLMKCFKVCHPHFAMILELWILPREFNWSELKAGSSQVALLESKEQLINSYGGH